MNMIPTGDSSGQSMQRDYTDGGLATASANIPGEVVAIGESRELGEQILGVDQPGRSVDCSLLAEQLSHNN